MGKSLLDTNIVSELRKKGRANPGVIDWFRNQPDEDIFLSVATFGEIRMCIERLKPRDPQQAVALDRWADMLMAHYRGRMLDITLEVFEQWGLLQAIRPVPVLDGLLAATAIHHDLALVTRNVDDFCGLGVRLLNPFGLEP